MNARRRRLLDELRDPEYRKHYAESHLNSTLATQISAIREQRGLTQTKLAERLGKQQAAISRIENVNYARWNIATLRDIASALDCWLSVRLESWGQLVEDVENYSAESLRRERFADDPVFWGSDANGPVAEPVRWVQQQLLPWLDHQPDDDGKLLEWLQGRNLPPVGDQDLAHVWITRAIEVEGPESRYRGLLIGWLARYIPIARQTAETLEDPDTFLTSLFSLAAVFHIGQLFWDPLRAVYDELAKDPDRLSETGKAALLTAIIRNQATPEFREVWFSTIRDGHHPFLPANELDAFEGLKWLPRRPNVRALAEGLKLLQWAIWKRRAVLDIESTVRDIRMTFEDLPLLDELLWREGQDAGWPAEVADAWFAVFAPTSDELPNILHPFSVGPRILLSEFHRRLGEAKRRGDADAAVDEGIEESRNYLTAAASNTL